MNKCVFLDRDGVLNEEIGDYVYELNKLIIPEGMPEALQKLKKAGLFTHCHYQPGRDCQRFVYR
jgi:histidinol phosphatase-like enzyme